MPDISYNDYFLDQPQTPIARDILPPIMAGYCELTRRNPWLVGGGMTRVLRDHWCSPRHPPLPPAPPDQNPPGGQCCGVVYDVTFRTTHQYIAPAAQNFRVNGKVRFVRNSLVRGAPSTGSTPVWGTTGSWDFWSGMDCPGQTPQFRQWTPPTNSSPLTWSVSVVRVDGQPDECGGLLPYVSPPQLIPPDAFNFNVPITIAPNVVVNIPFSIPITNITNNVNIRPELNIGSPEFNLTLNFDGITITSNPAVRQPTPPYRLPDIPDSRLPPAPNRPPVRPPVEPNPPGRPPSGGGTVCPDLNLQPVLDAIAPVATNVELLLDCERCDRPAPEDCIKGLFGTASSGQVLIDKAVKWVGVELSEVPRNARTQFGGNAQDVIYAGWYEFGGEGVAGDRNPIHYRNNIYPVLEGSSQFSFTVYDNFKANIYLYTRGGNA